VLLPEPLSLESSPVGCSSFCSEALDCVLSEVLPAPSPRPPPPPQALSSAANRGIRVVTLMADETALLTAFVFILRLSPLVLGYSA
jgi:hypothetical protein